MPSASLMSNGDDETIWIFNHLSDGFQNADRAGTNVITEILHNRNNNAFAA